MKDKYKKDVEKMLRNGLDDIEQIELDIKVPNVMSGNTELNNALYLKNLATKNKLSNSQKYENMKRSPSKMEIKTDKTRQSILKSINEEVLKRKSRDITNESLRNNFRITKLEQL